MIVKLIIKTGCDVVKTSTGFGTGGANENGIRFLKSLTESKIRIKASGGIATHEDCLNMLHAGADIIGSSKGLEIIDKSL